MRSAGPSDEIEDAVRAAVWEPRYVPVHAA
jgi:hypothetical protein